MSYNTRNRQVVQGMGVGRGTSQVVYHQQQQRPGVGGANQQKVSQNTQQSRGYSQKTASGGSVQSKPGGPGRGSPQNEQPTAPSAPQSVSSKQYQTQQQQQPPQPPPKLQPQPPPKLQPPQSDSKPEPPSPKPPAADPTTVIPGKEATPVDEMETDDGEVETVIIWEPKPKRYIKKRLPGVKVNKALKRRRQNARLRRILQPKNAAMVLNELKAGVKFTFHDLANPLTETMFLVDAEVDGKIHSGQGLSKPLAKQNAAENALRALLLEKMAENALKATEDAANISEPMEQDADKQPSASGDNASDVTPDKTCDVKTSDVKTFDKTSDVKTSDGKTSDVNASDVKTSDGKTSDVNASDVKTSDKTSDVKNSDAETSDVNMSDVNTYINDFGKLVRKPAEDDVPWGSLASFALYKLFVEWQNQGNQVPVSKQATPTPVAPSQPVKSSSPPSKNSSRAPSKIRRIPDNATEKHPGQLLNQLKPGTQFVEINRRGTPPNLIFTMGVTVDGKLYKGVATNKKEARKAAAISALAGALKIFYD